jgi:hypothetical protein
LPAMLQHRQPVINRLVNAVFTDDSDDAAHVFRPRLYMLLQQARILT